MLLLLLLLFVVNLGALMLKALFEYWPSAKSPEPEDKGMCVRVCICVIMWLH